MKKILLLATGGTIASRATPHGLRPALTAEDMRAAVGAADSIEICDLLSLDSTNIAPSHWQTIARKIAAVRTAYDGFIVTHGTDTMAYTAAARWYMLAHMDRPAHSARSDRLARMQRPICCTHTQRHAAAMLASASHSADASSAATQRRKSTPVPMMPFAALAVQTSTSPRSPLLQRMPRPFTCRMHSTPASPSSASIPG